MTSNAESLMLYGFYWLVSFAKPFKLHFCIWCHYKNDLSTGSHFRSYFLLLYVTNRFFSSIAIRVGNQNHFAELLPLIDIFEEFERVRDAYDLYSSLLGKYPGVSALTFHTCFVNILIRVPAVESTWNLVLVPWSCCNASKNRVSYVELELDHKASLARCKKVHKYN